MTNIYGVNFPCPSCMTFAQGMAAAEDQATVEVWQAFTEHADDHVFAASDLTQLLTLVNVFILHERTNITFDRMGRLRVLEETFTEPEPEGG